MGVGVIVSEGAGVGVDVGMSEGVCRRGCE